MYPNHAIADRRDKHHSVKDAKFDPVTVGTFFAAISAAAYTASSIFLRLVALDCDPMWVSCLRALPITLASLVVVAHRARQNLPALPPRHMLFPLIGMALVSQFCGNAAYQWSLGHVGLAVTAPLTFGALIVGSATLGWLFLRERLALGSIAALVLLLVSIALIGSAANEAAESIGHESPHEAPDTLQPGPPPLTLTLAVLAALMAGAAYAALNSTMRRFLTQHSPLSGTLLVIGGCGVVGLGVASVLRLGITPLLETEPQQLGYMLTAGVFNAIAFFSIGKGLQHIPVVRANALNSSQLALTALAGILVFGEPASAGLFAGLALMVAGLFLMQRGGPR